MKRALLVVALAGCGPEVSVVLKASNDGRVIGAAALWSEPNPVDTKTLWTMASLRVTDTSIGMYAVGMVHRSRCATLGPPLGGSLEVSPAPNAASSFIRIGKATDMIGSYAFAVHESTGGPVVACGDL